MSTPVIPIHRENTSVIPRSGRVPLLLYPRKHDIGNLIADVLDRGGLSGLVPVVDPAEGRQDSVHTDGGIHFFESPLSDTLLDDGQKTIFVAFAQFDELPEVGFFEVAPLVVESGDGGGVAGGDVEVEEDQLADLLAWWAAFFLYLIDARQEAVCILEADVFEDLLLAVDVTVKAGSL